MQLEVEMLRPKLWFSRFLIKKGELLTNLSHFSQAFFNLLPEVFPQFDR